MDEPQPIHRNPRRQIVIAILIVIVLYAFLMGRQGAAQDVALSGGYAILAAGSNGGVRFLDVANPAEPREIGWYDTPGSAQRVALSGRYAFVADGRAGLRILDLASLLNPVEIGAVELPGEVLDVTLAGNYAYLARGEFGVTIVDVSRPALPLAIASLDTPGEAYATTVTQIISAPPGLTPGTPEYQQQARIQAVYVYVADGDRGLQVIDALTPVEPRLLGNYNTSGRALDVALIGPYAVVAGERDGVYLLEITDPNQPNLIAEVDTPGDALYLAAASPLVYVADRDEGLAVIDFSNTLAPTLLATYDLPGSSLSVAIKERRAFMVQGEDGLTILDVQLPSQPVPAGFYETPGEASIGQILRAIPSILTFNFGEVQTKVWRTLAIIALDLFILVLTLLAWLWVYAQFVLPVRTLSDRQEAFKRLRAYFTGARGPAIFIKNGAFTLREKERERRGPGVAILDTASGAVFRTRQAFTQTAGPGVVFTRPNEYIAGAVDLRNQSQQVGPEDGEDPFAPQGAEESPEDYKKRQGRLLQTRGLTRDWIEVAPRISCSFRLISTPGEGNTQFGYSPFSVWNAITREGINPGAEPHSDSRRVPWTSLPCKLAVGMWREYLHKFSLNQLFSFSGIEEEPHKNAYDIIVEMVKARLTSPEVDELDEAGQPTGERKPSKEFALLKERGIEVRSVSIRSLHFPAAVQKQMVDEWAATWLDRTLLERDQVNKILADERTRGQETALKEFASSASLHLAQARQSQPDLRQAQTLEHLVEGLLELCEREPDLLSRLTDQRTRLSELVEWARTQPS